MLDLFFYLTLLIINRQSSIPPKAGRQQSQIYLQRSAHFKTDVDKYRGETETTVVPRT